MNEVSFQVLNDHVTLLHFTAVLGTNSFGSSSRPTSPVSDQLTNGGGAALAAALQKKIVRKRKGTIENEVPTTPTIGSMVCIFHFLHHF